MGALNKLVQNPFTHIFLKSKNVLLLNQNVLSYKFCICTTAACLLSESVFSLPKYSKLQEKIRFENEAPVFCVPTAEIQGDL